LLRIAITQRVIEPKEYIDYRDALSHDWPLFLQKILPGCVVIPVPNTLNDVSSWFNAIEPDCLILSNGNDWGAVIQRDETEFKAIEWALDGGIPVLGICRGLQVINKYFGGYLTQELSAVTAVPHVAASHSISIVKKTFDAIINEGDIVVNSYHNQGIQIQGLPPKLDAFAMTADQIVEGLFHPELSVLGVQWHPERPGSNEAFDAALLRKFILVGKFW